MVELIIAMNNNGGIGKDGILPWNCKKELLLFKKKTIGKTIVVGRKTLEKLPILPNRKIICISRNSTNIESKNDIHAVINDLELLPNDVIIAGGAEVYKSALSIPNLVKVIHLSIMNGEHNCDTFFDKSLLDNFVIVKKNNYEDFQHYVLESTSNGERQYIKLLANIINNGKKRIGRNGKTISLFKNDMLFDLTNGFPLLTTKKMFIRGIIEELLFFIRGDTNSKILEEKNVNIWKGNSNREFLDSIGMTERKEGVLGPCYGYQWRHFNANYDENEAKPLERGIDQLENVINLINNNPHSRRIMLTSFNPEQIQQCVLPPCHSVFIQFYVEENFLDMYAINRSSDVFLGLPFNIASYALFLSIIAKITMKKPRYLHISLGDTHIYNNHILAVKTQIKRMPYKFPEIIIPNITNLNDIINLNASDFVFVNYKAHSVLKAKMIP